jgi:hypothetical protein
MAVSVSSLKSKQKQGELRWRISEHVCSLALHAKAAGSGVENCDKWDEITETDRGQWAGVSNMIQVYVFGDRFVAPQFRRIMAKAIDDFDKLGAIPHKILPLVDDTFEHIPSHHLNLQFLVDCFYEMWEGFKNVTRTLSLCKTSLGNLFVARVMKRSESAPKLLREKRNTSGVIWSMRPRRRRRVAPVSIWCIMRLGTMVTSNNLISKIQQEERRRSQIERGCNRSRLEGLGKVSYRDLTVGRKKAISMSSSKATAASI